ncbi:MAG: sigma-54 dependent transcriptional regulator [Deltaproteobacteria bacterium]|nr:sigma-54 dependent transcriptional regulator [Deltaproteobacteria bacterium]
MTRALLVDDDPHLRLALSKALIRKGVDVVDVASGEAALEPLKSGISSAGPVDVCLLDLRMPGMSGLEVLRRTLGRKVPVVVLTGHGTVPDAVEAMRLGAVNFVQKPVDADELVPILKQAQRTEPPAVADAMLGASEAMLAFLEKLDRAARSDEHVLLIGETGTGKELCARRIHDVSAHKRGPFVAMNAAAIPRELVESELFGHRRGAFTGAAEARDGMMHKAADGTLFLDEIGEMPLDVQPKVLRAIEERRFRPVGADVERPFKGRIVAATHRDLKLLVEQGRFRADLYYRLGVIPLHLPPLRERGDDVVLIARAWLGRAVEERPVGRANPALSFTPAAEEQLRQYPWPGNVRELVNVVKRAALFSQGDVVDEELIGELLEDSPFAHGADQPPLPPTSGDHRGDDAAGPRAGQRVTMEELEKTHIRRLLDELHNVSEVARIVGIDRRTLQRKMIAWGFRDST